MTNTAHPAIKDMSRGRLGEGFEPGVGEDGTLILTAASIRLIPDLARGGLLNDWANAQRILLDCAAVDAEAESERHDHAAVLRHVYEVLAVPIFIRWADPKDFKAIRGLMDGTWTGVAPQVAAELDGDVVAASIVQYLDGPLGGPADLAEAVGRRTEGYALVAKH